MPAVLSRPTGDSLPYDVLRIIASFLTSRELKKFIILCRAYNLAGIPVLYRSVEAWINSVDFECPGCKVDNKPVQFLFSIVNSTVPNPALDLPSRNYAHHLVTLCYGSWSTPCDLRALPLLTEALRFTHRLCHLRLDVPSETVPILLDLFRRSSIIITPSTMLPGFNTVDRRPLASLQSLRTSRIAIADALMQHRAIETVAVDLSIKWEVLAKFLRTEAPWTPTHLLRLSLFIGDCPATDGILEGVLIAFPRLQHVALRINAKCASALVKAGLRVLADMPSLGQSLRSLSINHGSVYTKYSTALENLRSTFAEGFPGRPGLREVVMGLSMWSRTTASENWSFVNFGDSPDPFLENWPWLHYRNEGDWIRFGEAVRAYDECMC